MVWAVVWAVVRSGGQWWAVVGSGGVDGCGMQACECWWTEGGACR